MNKKTFLVMVVIMTFVLIVITIFLCTAIIKNKIIDNLIEVESFHEERIAKGISLSLENEFKEIDKKLKLISEVPEIREGGTEKCGSKLKEIYNEMDIKLGNMGRMNKEGIFYCGVVDDIVGVDGKKYDYLRTILDDPEHKPVLSPAIMFQYINYSRYLTAMHIPVYKDEDFVGTLGAAVYFDELYEKYLKEIAHEFKEENIMLLDENGDILYYTNHAIISKNIFSEETTKELYFPEHISNALKDTKKGNSGRFSCDMDGEVKVSFYFPVEVFSGRTWTLIMTLPMNYFEEQLENTKINYYFLICSIIIFGILLFFMIFMIFLLIKSIINPIKKITLAVEKIAEGNLNMQLDPKIVQGRDEIGNLAKSFEDMRVNLKKSRDQLVEKKKLEIAHQNLKKTSNALVKSNKLKDFFVDIMNHDLLNPIGVVRLDAEIMESDEKDIKKKSTIKKIYRNSNRAIKMIENAYSLSKLQEGEKIVFAKEDVGKILAKAVKDVEPRAMGKNIKIKSEIEGKFPAMVNSLIYNVFYNLLTNATKYAPEKTTISIKIKKKDSNLRITVRDKGEGIPDKFKKAIFDRFTRINRGAIKGSGLGLAITKKIVEVHKGKVWVKDNPGGGSIFVVEIPIKRPKKEVVGKVEVKKNVAGKVKKKEVV